MSYGCPLARVHGRGLPTEETWHFISERSKRSKLGDSLGKTLTGRDMANSLQTQHVK